MNCLIVFELCTHPTVLLVLFVCEQALFLIVCFKFIISWQYCDNFLVFSWAYLNCGITVSYLHNLEEAFCSPPRLLRSIQYLILFVFALLRSLELLRTASRRPPLTHGEEHATRNRKWKYLQLWPSQYHQINSVPQEKKKKTLLFAIGASMSLRTAYFCPFYK